MPLAQLPTGELEACVQRAMIDLSEAGVTANELRTRLAVIDAVAHHEGEPWHFLELRMEFATKNGVSTYGVDDGVPAEVEWIDEDLQVDIQADPDNRRFMVRVSPTTIERLREGTAYSSWPERWTYYGNKLELWPTPDAVHTVHFRGNVDPPRPTYRWDVDTSAFIIEEPTVSVWFTGKQEIMIRRWAEWTLLSAPERDGENGQHFMNLYSTARASLVSLNEEKKPVGTIEPYPDELGLA